MPTDTEIAIIGAGPYGLSLSAHLRGRKVEHRIIGSPMQSWISEMPKGMQLKSDGFASGLYDPHHEFTLGQYCRDLRLPYADLGYPVPLEVFCAYGLEFQKRYVPGVQDKRVVEVRRGQNSFVVRLDDGETFSANNVVLAIGVGYFRYVPPELAHLPKQYLTHAGEHHDLEGFRGREVAVIGAGSSAVDLAVLLREAGANPHVVARGPAVYIHDRMRLPRTLRDQIRAPNSGIGPGWKYRFLCEAPHLFRYFPKNLRFRIVRNYVGPSGGWFMKERFRSIAVSVDHTPKHAEVSDGRVVLHLEARDRPETQFVTDHVIAATGYKVDLRRLTFLADEIRDSLRNIAHTPVLSAHFASSESGLYVIGPASAHSFGPVMRFAHGARFAVPRLARHLASKLRGDRISRIVPIRLAQPST